MTAINIDITVYYLLAGIIGACIGSFLNVVIYRLPKMLHYNWFCQCYEFLKLKPYITRFPSFPLNLHVPRSHCTHCFNRIKVIDNIPILSFCLLKGKCRFCQHKISWLYPSIELLSAVLAIFVVMHFGITWQAICALTLTWLLIAQAGIDYKQCFIPDEITIPALWLGLIVNHFNVFQSLPHAIFGAVLGYLILWIVYWLFKLTTHKEGLGYGDFKLLAMLGAWLGWQNLPFIVFSSALLGSIVGIILIICKKHHKNEPLPFGPYLALAGWIAMLYGEQINSWYWRGIII